MRVIETGYRHTDQTFHFRVPLGGPFALWYRTARVPGFGPALRARVPLTGSEPPEDLKKLRVSTSLDGYREATTYRPGPHVAHTVAAPSPREVTVRIEYRFRQGSATSERRLILGRPDPRDLGLGGLLPDGMPVVDGGVVRFADGGSAPVRPDERGVRMARARGSLFVVEDGRIAGVHDAISGRTLWSMEEDGGRLIGPDGSGLEILRAGSRVELYWRERKTTLEIDGWVRAIHAPEGTAEIELTDDGLVTDIRDGDWRERADYAPDGRLQNLWRGDVQLAFVRTPLPDGYRAAVSDGVTVDRRTEIRFIDGAIHREERCCGHAPTRVVRAGDEVTAYRADGTVVTRSGGRNARTVTTTLPSGATRTFRVARTVRSDEATQIVEAGDGVWSMRRDAKSGVIEWRSPGGRVRRLVMDDQDRVVEHRDYDGSVRRHRWDRQGVTVEGPAGQRRLDLEEDGGVRQSSAAGSRRLAFGKGGVVVERAGCTIEAAEGGVTVDGRPYLAHVLSGSMHEVVHGSHRLATSTTDGGTETLHSEGALVVDRGMDGRPLRMVGEGVDRTFEWDHGRLVRAATPTSENRVSWDGAELRSMSQVGGVSGQISFERDTEGGLSAVTILGDRFEVEAEDGVVVRLGPATWELDPSAIRPSVMRAGAVEQHYRYDEWGRRIEVRVAHAGRDLLTLRWAYDEAGRVATLDVGGEVHRYRYDGELLVGVEGADPQQMEYAEGRLVKLSATAVDVDAVGRPTAVDGHAVDMTPGGRIRSVRLGDAPVRLAYNAAGELTTIEGPDEGGTSIIRDALGRPVWIEGPDRRRGIVWGPEGPVASLDPDGRVEERYVRRPGRRTPDLITGEDGTRVVVSDHLGSPVALVDVETGAVERSSWSAFGTRRSGDSLIGFAGAIQLSRVPDVLDMGVRSYLPAVARWAQWDPMLHRGGGTDLYGYAAGDPVNHVDPTGTTVEVCRDHEGLRHRWIRTGKYESGQDQVQSGEWYERGFNTEWVDHTGRRGTTYRSYSCEPVEDVSEDCVNRRIKPGTDIGVYLFEPMYRTFRIGNTGIDVPLPSICWNVVEDVLADCKILRGEDPSLMCRGMPALPPPSEELDHTPDLGYTPDPESMQTLDRDHTPDLGYTPVEGGG